MLSFADSHSHLADSAFADDVDAVIFRARAAGARALICIGESPAAAARSQSLAARFPLEIFHTCGVHPYDATSWVAARDEVAIREAVSLGAVAVGECGLDSTYEHAPMTQQRLVLNAQCAIAAELRKPIVLHSRGAESDTIDFLRAAKSADVRGVLHCFTGSRTLLEAGLDADWYISFSGIVTFAKWDDNDAIKMVPADRLLVESDAPYLAPVPHRGKRNEPAFVARTLARVAEVRDTDIESLGYITLQNTGRLFGFSQSAPPHALPAYSH